MVRGPEFPPTIWDVSLIALLKLSRFLRLEGPATIYFETETKLVDLYLSTDCLNYCPLGGLV